MTTQASVDIRAKTPADGPADAVEISVVIPCLNESENIELCVSSALESISKAGLRGEVVVADNGSTDGSGELARAAGARVVTENRRGYGSAYLAGLAAARGDYIVMGDADLTYDFDEIPAFVAELDAGADMVMGNRLENIQPGAMPWLHRYVGNPVLSKMLNVMYGTRVTDCHCGMRAIRRDAVAELDLRTTGMEFASEMVVKAARARMTIHEFPIDYHPRGGESKLSTWGDGWRHLRFLLAHSPRHLFLVPGSILMGLGAIAVIAALLDSPIFGRQWGLHSEIAGMVLFVAGLQTVSLGICAQAFSFYYLGDHDPWIARMRNRYRLEHGLMIGGIITTVGLLLAGAIVWIWAGRGFGALAETKLAVLASMLVISGLQVFFTSFLLSILGLGRSNDS